MQNVPKCILTTIQRSYLRQYHKIGSTVCRAYITTCKCEMSTLPERSSYMYIIQTLMDPLNTLIDLVNEDIKRNETQSAFICGMIVFHQETR